MACLLNSYLETEIDDRKGIRFSVCIIDWNIKTTLILDSRYSAMHAIIQTVCSFSCQMSDFLEEFTYSSIRLWCGYLSNVG